MKKIYFILASVLMSNFGFSQEIETPDFKKNELKGNALMLMVHDKLRVGLLTDHIPVNEVSKHLTGDLLIKKIDILLKYFFIPVKVVNALTKIFFCTTEGEFC